MIPDNIKTVKYYLLDIESGLGFSTIYFNEKYDFITYEGFDYDSKLDGMSKQILTQFYIDKIIDFYQADASENLLDQDKPYTLFLF
jgi:predicted O-methyltransferase YrrM